MYGAIGTAQEGLLELEQSSTLLAAATRAAWYAPTLPRTRPPIPRVMITNGLRS